MKKAHRIIIAVFCILILATAGKSAYAAGLSRLDETEKEKIICVVYDNSSSMFQDDDPPKEYTDRWVQADYAMKALALMMNSGDTLRPYIMGDYKTEGRNTAGISSIQIKADSKVTLNELEKKMNAMKFTEMTYFEGVEEAAEDLKKSQTKNKDCWIIILTDGVFTSPEKMKDGKDSLVEELEKITADNANVSIGYVPIGKNAISLEGDRKKRIYTAEGGSIMEQVTRMINLIYGRVQLDESTKEDYVQQGDEAGRLNVRMDVPVEKMIVLLQDAGETGNYVDLEEGLEEKLNKRITAVDPTVTDAFVKASDIAFSGRSSVPGIEKGVKSHESAKIQYSILRGLIYNFTGNSEQNMDMEDQYVSIEVGRDAYDTVDVYYQPAVLVEMDYYQNGEKIEHGEGCTAALGGEETEKCIREGEMTIQLYMTDSSGTPIEKQDSPLLYENNFVVEMRSQDGTLIDQQELGGYRYQFQVEEGTYTLNITTAWNEVYAKQIEVQEPIRPLELERVSPDRVWIDQKEGDGSVLSVQIREGGEILGSAAAKNTEVECRVKDEDFIAERMGYQGDGIWKFRILLKDYEQHQIADSIECDITAVRKYQSGTKEVTGEPKDATISLQVVSGDFELSIEPKEKELLHPFRRIFLGEKLPLKYLCDGEELTEKQKKEGLVIQDFQIEPEYMNKYLGIDRNNNLQLKGGWIWLFSIPEEIEVSMSGQYERYNTLKSFTIACAFSVKDVPLFVKIIIYIVIGLVIFWIAAYLCKKKFSRFYIGSIEAKLSGTRGGVPRDVKVKRLRQSLIPPCRTARLVFKESAGIGDPYIKSFNLKFMRNPGGDGWKIVNYGDFADSKRYRIGKSPVTEKNRIFSKKVPFFVLDKDGNEKKLELNDKRK